MKKTTLKDVADYCGISLSLASRVINGKPRVSDEVRKRVLEAVETLQYRAHGGIGTRKHVAVLYPDLLDFKQNNYTFLLLANIYNTLTERGFYYHGIHSLDLVKNYPFFAAISLQLTQKLGRIWSDEFDIPLIAINRNNNSLGNRYSVCMDVEGGVEMGINLLYRYGHRKIGMLVMEESDWGSQLRMAGYRESMRKRGLPPEEFLQIIPPSQLFHESMGRLIHRGITALIAPAEGFGQRVCHALTLYKYRIPEDISLLTWEVPGVSEEWIPRLTTLGQDFRGLAESAADLLTQLAAKENAVNPPPVKYFLHERDSVRQPAMT